MANTVKLKRSAVQGKAPAVGDLELGEIAINTYDGKIYIKKNDGSDSIVAVGGSIAVGSSAPSSPTAGDLWYDTESARTFVYTGAEWADASPDANNSTVISGDNPPSNPEDGDLWFDTSDGVGRLYLYYVGTSSSQWIDASPDSTIQDLTAFRNVLINGAVTINQRGVSYASASVGDYWADRWKKTSSGMKQIVEDGNYEYSTQYTLSGTGVTTAQGTSPASGDWDISSTFGDVIPGTATDIQLEKGSVATPFEHRSYGQELALCQRYYEAGILSAVSATTGMGYTPVSQGIFKVTKRHASPTVAQTSVAEAVNIDAGGINNITSSGFKIYYATISGSGYRTAYYSADAEL